MTVESATKPLALFRGEPLHELPGDLYIPPDALRVFSRTFEGPLDLLLYLIRKHNLDVLDSPCEPDPPVHGVRRSDAAASARTGRRVSADGCAVIEIKSRMLLRDRLR